jgi:TRAP-type transport system periplasmic protein
MVKKLCMVMILVSFSFILYHSIPAQAQQKPIEWRLSHWFMPKGYVGDGYAWFAKEITKRTGGRLQIEVYPNGALGFKTSEALSFVKKGNLEIVDLGAGPTAGEEPLIGFSELPFLFPTERDGFYWIKWVYDPVLYPFMEKKWNVKLISEFRFPPVEVWAKKKIEKIDDCQGMKLRCYGGVLEEALKNMGFKTFSITTSELLPALQQGMIDSLITTAISATETRVYEHVKYKNELDMVRPMYWVAANKDAFNALPKDLQEILMDTGRDFSNYMFVEEVRIETEFLNKLAQNGIVTNIVPMDTRLEMAKRSMPIWKKVADRAGAEAVKMLKDLGKY